MTIRAFNWHVSVCPKQGNLVSYVSKLPLVGSWISISIFTHSPKNHGPQEDWDLTLERCPDSELPWRALRTRI